ncbi:hypothetical protein QA601_05260 [Chitinispirillales bacterium ANBcel5]|uniref:ATP-grasp domain-containing protein n=1 Tax=Cellulosispirillum alkaliphilum TaxID=3039283 RepID=UPI002A55196F|nr:hypothetical protein [Chitinispirillales bacterium ANBcel5]
MKKQVFVIGIDPFNAQRLREIQGADEIDYHCLISYKEAHEKGFGEFEALRRLGEHRIEEWGITPDAVISWWDYPSTCLAAWFKRQLRLPGASLESVIHCEHKYWSRCAHMEVIPENTPQFQALNPFSDNPLNDLEISFPFWIKPVKSVASQLALRVTSEKDFFYAIEKMQHEIHRYGEPFNQALQHITLPPEVMGIDGMWCIIEKEIATDSQCTLSGYVHNGEVYPYGVVDSINYTHLSSFFRYEYPSRLPDQVKKRIISLGTTVMNKLGYDNQAFNIEFYYDKKDDHLWLLEVNPRISQSHAECYKRVDGMSNLKVMVDLGLGRKPDVPYRQGDAAVSAKCYFRHFSDGTVLRAPTREEIERVQEQVSDSIIFWDAPEGVRLSDLKGQDSYSYCLGIVYLSAGSREELLQKYIRILDSLPYYIEDVK